MKLNKKILLMGLRRSGKSSIQQVVFHTMPLSETLFLESTTKVQKVFINHNAWIQFQIWDFPGQVDFFDPSFDSKVIFGDVGALVFVMDAQDDYIDALSKLVMTVTRAYKANPKISFEVFIHKVDGLSDDHKIETQRDIQQRLSDELLDSGLDQLVLNFYLTSIYDHSIFEAFSKVIQKLIPQLPNLENLLNILCSNNGIEKAFLFDVLSKIYFATDSSPVDMQTYELCSDMIDVTVDIGCIYGLPLQPLSHSPTLQPSPEQSTSPPIQMTSPVVESNVTLPPIPQDESSSACIQLNNGMVLYLRHITGQLALVCLFRGEQYVERKGLMEVNFKRFIESIRQVFQVGESLVSPSVDGIE